MLKIDLPQEMIENYLSRRALDLEVVKSSVATNDIEAIHRIGHQLRGNASSYGFPDLELIGISMDELKAEDLKQKGPEIIAIFSQWISENLRK